MNVVTIRWSWWLLVISLSSLSLHALCKRMLCVADVKKLALSKWWMYKCTNNKVCKTNFLAHYVHSCNKNRIKCVRYVLYMNGTYIQFMNTYIKTYKRRSAKYVHTCSSTSICTSRWRNIAKSMYNLNTPAGNDKYTLTAWKAGMQSVLHSYVWRSYVQYSRCSLHTAPTNIHT